VINNKHMNSTYLSIKRLPKSLAIVFMISLLMLSYTSCSSMKSDLNTRREIKNNSKATPVSKKKEPLPKNFKLKKSKQSILGQERK